VKDQVRRACLSAFRAPVSTALVAAIGFIPAATATGTGAEVQRPLATVVIGGLLIGMVMSMFSLPAMLFLVARHEARHAKLRDDDEAVAEALGGHHHGHEAHPAE
jgi:cobalt-zinc-cadmium resistance protein CzcA